MKTDDRYRRAAAAGGVGIWDWNLATDEVYVDPVLKEMLGYQDHEIRNHMDVWGRLVHPDDSAAVFERVQRHLAGETPLFEIEHRMLHRDGSIRWFLARGSVTRNTRGDAVQMVGTDTDITARKRGEEALRQLEEINKRIAESTGDCVKILDLDGRLIYINSEGLRQLELEDGSALLNVPLVAPLEGETRKAAEEAIEVAKRGGTGRFQAMLRTASGVAKWFDLVVTPITDVSGAVVQLLAVSRDISERRREESFRAGCQQVLRMIATGSALPDVLDCLVHLVEQQSNGMRCSVLLLDDDGAHVRHGAAPSLPDEYVRAIDGSVIGPRSGSCGTAMFLGTRIIVSDILTDPLWEDYRDVARQYGLRACWSTPMFSVQRKVLGSFAIYYDEPRTPNDDELRLIESAADLARLAIEQERAQEALRQSEARYRLLYDNTPSMFFTVDSDGAVRSVNRFATEHLGYGTEELVGQSVLRVVHPQDHAVVTGHLAACFADPGTVRTLSFRKIRKDGSLIWVKEATRVVDSPDGANMLIICEDVTESRAHEEAARKAASEVHHKDEFMAMLGHELRNPLSPIVTALEILRRRGLQEPELEVIDRQVSHLRRLVDDLLDVSRITRGKVELHKERVELGGVAAQAVEVARPLFQAKRQTLYVAFASRGLAVDADPARLVQVFANLLTNAAKYSEEGSDVHFSAERHGERIVVRVRDQGEGIEPEMLDRVFDVFVQRPQPADRAQSGLGLGLTIVRSLITLHGGTVRAVSEGQGKGTTVEVDLPAASGESLVPAVPLAGGAADRASAVEILGSILVVDDNDDVRESLCRLLTMLGYRATSASDGPSALQAVERIRPQVAVVDIGLPGMDGYELARRLRRASPTGLRLVAVTGYGQESDRARSREAGFDAHLVKPIDLDALLPQLLGPA